MDIGPLMDWLADPANFTETLTQAGEEMVQLDPWQRSYISSSSRFTLILKSRRVGGSWAMTARMFARSQTIARYNGVFISMNREEARGKIDYAEELYESLPAGWKLKRVSRSKDEIAFVDARRRKSTLRSLAGKAPRGRGGDVGISELPHCLNSANIYEGALHVTARDIGHQLTVESTPLGKRGVFHDLCSGKYPQFTRYRVPWWLCSALCVDILQASQTAPAMTTGDRVERFGSSALKSIYRSMSLPAFRQESELEFVEVEDAAFPMEMILACAQPEFGDGPDNALVYRHMNRPPTDNDWAWLARNINGTLVAGYDPARKNDRSALIILDQVDDRFEARMSVNMRDVTFTVQREVVQSAIKNGVRHLRIDATGIGMDMSERLKRDYPGIVEGIMFSPRSKQMMVSGFYNTLADKRITLPAERGLLGETGSIRQSVSSSGITLYSSPSDSAGHGDSAWALLLAHSAGRGNEPAGNPEVGYQPVTRRSVWSARSVPAPGLAF